MAHVSKRHPEAAAALKIKAALHNTKVESKAEMKVENPRRTDQNPGKANFIKLRVPSRERGNNNSVVGGHGGWHTSVVCPQCDYNPTSETDLKNHVRIAHDQNHEEDQKVSAADDDGGEHFSEAPKPKLQDQSSVSKFDDVIS